MKPLHQWPASVVALPNSKRVKTVAETECELRQVLGTHRADCEACRERAVINQVKR